MLVKIKGNTEVIEANSMRLFGYCVGAHSILCENQLAQFREDQRMWRNIHKNSDGQIIQYDFYCPTCNRKIYHFKNDVFYVKRISVKELNKHGYPIEHSNYEKVI